MKKHVFLTLINTEKISFLLIKEAIISFTFLLLRNGYVEHKEYFLDNEVEIYSSQTIEKFIILYSKRRNYSL